MKLLLIRLVTILVTQATLIKSEESSANIGNNFTGVFFAPYVDNFVKFANGTQRLPRAFDAYTIEEIKIMLKIISGKFQYVLVDGMGEPGEFIGRKWNEVNSICLTAGAAAELNKENKNRSIEITLIAYAQSYEMYPKVLELENALEAAKHANAIYPFTVSEIVLGFPTGSEHDETKIAQVLTNYKKRVSRQGLKFGYCPTTCDSILRTSNTTITKGIDFLICGMYTTQMERRKSGGTLSAAQHLFDEFLRGRNKLISFKNSTLDVRLMTGLHSGDDTNPYYNIKNMKIYWTAIAHLAKSHKIKTYLYEAFDEPWKEEEETDEIEEGYSGWWRKLRNDDPDSFEEKIFHEFDIIVNSSTGWNSVSTIVLVLAILFAVLLVLGIAISVRAYRNRKNIFSSKELKDCLQEDAIPNNPECPNTEQPVKNLDSFEANPSELIIDRASVLGSGEFGIVFQGTHNNIPVAVKTLKAGAQKAYLKALISEIKIMTHLGHHDNLVNLIGVCTRNLQRGKLDVILELCPGGSLQGYLTNHKNDFLATKNLRRSRISEYANTNIYTVHQLLQWSRQICTAMEYLESKRVIHSDLAARNVLLSEDIQAKVSDFGLSRKLYQYTKYVKKHQEPLPWRWMAIESLERLEFSHKSDVWSFGITLWEIYSLANLPYGGFSWTTDFSSRLTRGLRLHRPDLAYQPMYDVMSSCWKTDPDERPDFSTLQQMLQNIISVENLNTDLSQDSMSGSQQSRRSYENDIIGGGMVS